ncbi:MAG: hypothetical protein RR744_00440 [Cellulosilyticaceae bacterium]
MKSKFELVCESVQNRMDFENWCLDYDGLAYPYPYIHEEIDQKVYDAVRDFIEIEDCRYSLPIYWGARAECDCGCGGDSYSHEEWEYFYEQDGEYEKELSMLKNKILKLIE